MHLLQVDGVVWYILIYVAPISSQNIFSEGPLAGHLTVPKVDLFTKASSLVFSSVHDGEVYDQGRYSAALVYQHRSLKV